MEKIRAQDDMVYTTSTFSGMRRSRYMSSWRILQEVRKKRPSRSIDFVKKDIERENAYLIRDDECNSEYSVLCSKRKYLRGEFSGGECDWES